MARFVSGDLTDAVRRRVARYIDECEDCHREYMHHREFALKLERNLPTLGRPKAQRLDQLWSSLQTELHTTAARRSLAWRFWLGFQHAIQLRLGYGGGFNRPAVADSYRISLVTFVRRFASRTAIRQRHQDQVDRLDRQSIHYRHITTKSARRPATLAEYTRAKNLRARHC